MKLQAMAGLGARRESVRVELGRAFEMKNICTALYSFSWDLSAKNVRKACNTLVLSRAGHSLLVVWSVRGEHLSHGN